jgi:hypothetical protein
MAGTPSQLLATARIEAFSDGIHRVIIVDRGVRKLARYAPLSAYRSSDYGRYPVWGSDRVNIKPTYQK